MMLEHCLGDRYVQIIVAENFTKYVASGNEVEETEENIKQNHTLLSDPPKTVVLGILHLIVIVSTQHSLDPGQGIDKHLVMFLLGHTHALPDAIHTFPDFHLISVDFEDGSPLSLR